MNENSLFIPLKREFFQAFADGSKDTEYRVHGPRWNARTCRVGRAVTLSLGYGKRNRLQGIVTGFEVSDQPTKTDAWRKCYGNTTELAACIKIKLTTTN